MNLKDAFYNSAFLSLKHDSYFPVYERILEKYKNRKITLVEIGVLNGGSLFMWRDFLGPKARIIGIDLNPSAKKWEEFGFEIYIGDQGEEAFWDETMPKIGAVDVVIDDGGHTNRQQIVSVVKATPWVNDGGLIVVEDTHASYMEEFGNPSRFSFVSFTKHLMDRINARYGGTSRAPKPSLNRIYSVEICESMVVLRIDKRLCTASELLQNRGASDNALDYRYEDNILVKLRSRSLKRGWRGFYNTLKLKREYIRQNRALQKYFDTPDL